MTEKDKAKHDGDTGPVVARGETVGSTDPGAAVDGESDQVNEHDAPLDAGADPTESSATAADPGDDDLREDSDDAGSEPMVVGSDAPNLSDIMLARTVIGVLTVHFPERDVELVLDGPNALRVMAMYAHGFGRGDFIDPESSTQRAMWIAIDLEQALALSWWPRLPAKKKRMAIDPPIPAEAA